MKEEVVACRLHEEEKRLVQALAARRDTFVAHLIRELLLEEVWKELGEGRLQHDVELARAEG